MLVLAVVTLLFQDSIVHPHANRLGAKAHGYRQERVEPGAASKRQNPHRREINSAAARERASCAQEALAIRVFEAEPALWRYSPALI